MKKLSLTLLAMATPFLSFASEADLEMPKGFASSPDASILYWGFAVVVLGLLSPTLETVRPSRYPPQSNPYQQSPALTLRSSHPYATSENTA
ncbi:MAG: hypothetical protein IKN29_09100, partial [Bacteroidales bacterium]|nr:hypothetical protein [Bacteroidales bacterium]